MSQAPAKKPATYADLLAVPEPLVAEILDGELHTFPRPGARHARASSRLSGRLVPAFDDGVGGPGGWILLFEPELHLGGHVAVPDLAGWRRQRMPELPDVAFFTLAPDWVCEVLSPSTERVDRLKKLRIYAQAGIGHAWLLSPALESLEVYRLAGEHFLLIQTQGDAGTARIEPFAEIELDIAGLWSR